MVDITVHYLCGRIRLCDTATDHLFFSCDQWQPLPPDVQPLKGDIDYGLLWRHPGTEPLFVGQPPTMDVCCLTLGQGTLYMNSHQRNVFQDCRVRPTSSFIK